MHTQCDTTWPHEDTATQGKLGGMLMGAHAAAAHEAIGAVAGKVIRREAGVACGPIEAGSRGTGFGRHPRTCGAGQRSRLDRCTRTHSPGRGHVPPWAHKDCGHSPPSLISVTWVNQEERQRHMRFGPRFQALAPMGTHRPQVSHLQGTPPGAGCRIPGTSSKLRSSCQNIASIYRSCYDFFA